MIKRAELGFSRLVVTAVAVQCHGPTHPVLCCLAQAVSAVRCCAGVMLGLALSLRMGTVPWSRGTVWHVDAAFTATCWWLAEPYSCGAVAANLGVGSSVGWLTKWRSSSIERWQDQGHICHICLSYFPHLYYGWGECCGDGKEP